MPWHAPQLALAGWCEAAESAGGAPWQDVQARVPAVIQVGLVPDAPLPAKLPWQ